MMPQIKTLILQTQLGCHRNISHSSNGSVWNRDAERGRGGRTWFDGLQADRLPKVADDSQGVAVCKSTDGRPVHLQQHVPVVRQLPDVAHQHVQLHLAQVRELSQLRAPENLHHGAEVSEVPP